MINTHEPIGYNTIIITDMVENKYFIDAISKVLYELLMIALV